MLPSAGPRKPSWNQWSMQETLSTPVSSATRTTSASVGPMAAGPPGKSKLTRCTPSLMARRYRSGLADRRHRPLGLPERLHGGDPAVVVDRVDHHQVRVGRGAVGEPGGD